jgi:hypothetical protein
LVLVIRQEIVVLPIIKPTMAKGVSMAVKVKYSEPKVNQQNGSIINGVPWDWSRGIHKVNIVSRPNSPCRTYCHQIGHHFNECPFIEENVRQGFVEHFQNLNLEVARIKNHGYIELEDLYHERARILDRFKKHI